MAPETLFHVALGILGIGILPVMLNRPALAAFAYLTVLFSFPTVNWGVAEGVEAMNLYSRGTGVLYFSIVNVYLFGLAALSLVFVRRSAPAAQACNVRKYFYFFLVLFMVQAAIGVVDGVRLTQILKQRGTINLVNIGLVALALIRLVRTKNDARMLTNLILWVGGLRAAFGTVRYLFSGGDIANVYENVQRAGIKLTFFDINDSLVACLCATVAAWYMLDRKRPPWQRLFFAGLVVLEVFICAFSYRRTAWAGMALASTLFCFLQPVRTRLMLLFAGVCAVRFGLTFLIMQRFGALSEQKGTAGMLFYDLGSNLKEGRFAELYEAFRTIADNPVFGVGPWGGFGPGGMNEYMHSGLMHVWLKTGLLGLIPFVLMFLAFGRFALIAGKRISPEAQPLFWAGVAGLFFCIPNILFGTPIIEYRTMQMMGVCLALPYVAYGVLNVPGRVVRQTAGGGASATFAAARQKLIDQERRVGLGT